MLRDLRAEDQLGMCCLCGMFLLSLFLLQICWNYFWNYSQVIAGSPIKKGEEAYGELAIKERIEDAGSHHSHRWVQMATEPHLWYPVVKGPVTSYDYTMNLLDFVSWHILAKAEVINLEVLAWNAQVRSMPNISEESAHTKRPVSYNQMIQMERAFGNLTVKING